MNPHFKTRERCPACNEAGGSLLCRVDYLDSPVRDYLESFYTPQGGVELEFLAGATFALRECLGCGLVYQEEVPDEFLSHKLYEQWIDPGRARDLWAKERDVASTLTLVEELSNAVEHLGSRPARLRVLDFGMGWGEWCRVATVLGCEVWGIELSPTRLDFAVRAGIRTTSLAELQPASFDLVNAEQVFEHIPDPYESLVRLAAALKPGGMIKIGVPNGGDIARRLARWNWSAPKGSRDSLNPVAPLEHLNCFNRRALQALARRASLDPIEVRPRFVVHRASGRAPWRALAGSMKAALRPFVRAVRTRRSTSLYFGKPEDREVRPPGAR